MKKFILISLGFVLGLSVAAKQISYDDALAYASSFFAPQASSRKAVKGIPKSLTLAYTLNQPQKDVPALYVFNRGNNEGFVLVAADDQSKKILGYSYTGSFDTTDMPEHVQFWLERYAEQIRVLSENGALFTTNTKKYTPVASLFGGDETGILWNQTNPWRLKCPEFEVNGTKTHAYTGCVATAASQIMFYHKYPTTGKGSVSYTSTHKSTGQTATIEADFSQTTYDWDNMLPVYKSSDKSEKANAVALLCYHVGAAAGMTYSTSASSSSIQKIEKALINHFDYDNSLTIHYLDYDNEEHFMSIIQENLLTGLPIFVQGSTTSGGVHAFVCDGIDEDGLLHINWGWSGLSNGYFELTNLNPKEQGAGGSTSGYTKNIQILHNIQKQQGTTDSMLVIATDSLYPASFTQQGFKKTEKSIIPMRVAKIANQGYCKFEANCGTALFADNSTPIVQRTIAKPKTGTTSLPNVGSGNSYGQTFEFKDTVKNIAKDLPIGCYEYAFTVRNKENTFHQPLWVKSVGIAKNKVIITADSLYFYPIKVSAWSTANLPTNLTSSVDYTNQAVQLSWEGNEGTFRVFVWNDTKLKTYVTAENNLTIPMCEDGTRWAVFQSDEVSKTDVALALSDLAFGEAIVIQNTATSVDDVPVSKAGVSVNGSQINITTEEAENIAIYDSLGYLLYQTKATYASFQAPSAGVYIVKIGAKKHKIWVK